MKVHTSSSPPFPTSELQSKSVSQSPDSPTSSQRRITAPPKTEPRWLFPQFGDLWVSLEQGPTILGSLLGALTFGDVQVKPRRGARLSAAAGRRRSQKASAPPPPPSPATCACWRCQRTPHRRPSLDMTSLCTRTPSEYWSYM